MIAAVKAFFLDITLNIQTVSIMNKSVILRFGVLLGLGAVLSGCGGGSSGSKNQNTTSSSSVATSQSSSSVSSSSSSISSSEPSTTKLILQGRAVAEALAGGKVVVSIGSLTYETTIDDSLKYNITLDVPAENTNQPFVAVVTGSGADSWVQLAASYPSVMSLAEKAGGDGILTAEEYFGVNITALTTAQYAEMKNQLIPVDSDESRKNAFFAMHPIKSLEKSTSISRMLSDIDFKLPAPAKTTLEFLLDENLSETYNEAFRFYDNTLISTQIDLFKSDPLQSVVSSKKLSGTYFVESSNYNYLLTFNEDGTGNLQAAALGGVITWDELPAINADFTWIRKGTQVRITPILPLVQYVNYYIDHGGAYYSCNDYDQSNSQCRVIYEYFDIELIADIDAGRFAYFRPRIKVENENGYIYAETSPSELSRIISAKDLSPITESELVGQDWYTSDHRYVFDENSTVLKTNLSTKNTESFAWELNGARLVIAEETLWFSAKDIAGYSILSVENSRAMRKFLYKRTPVNMTESDWIGRWTAYPYDRLSYSQDVNIDKTWRDGFEAEGAGGWSIINNHTQSAISNGAWRMHRDVLAIHGDKYYMSVCQGKEAEIFVPYNCYLSVATRSASFDTVGFWGSWSYPAFNEKNSGQNWIPLGGSILQTIENTGNISTEYIRVASNKLLNRYDLTILEMTNAGKDEIELCEYKLFEDCTESEKRVYLRGIELKLTVSGEGDILMRHESYFLEGGYTTYERSVANMLMVPKGYPQELIIKPDAGGLLSSDAVSGCGGTLVGEIYRIPALVEPCEITVNF